MARKHFSADFKAKVALEAIRGHLTVNEFIIVDFNDIKELTMPELTDFAFLMFSVLN